MVLNYIWVAFFLIAFIIALYKLIFEGDIEIFDRLIKSTFDQSSLAFELALHLTGAMAMWLGIMKIGEKAGIVKMLTFVFGPFFRRLFPEIPTNHPAITPIFMKLSANLLGLDNAGTPLGIKAMQEMQKLNPKKEEASNAQIMFAVLNTTGLTFIPLTVMIYRARLQAANPSDIFIPILISAAVTGIAGMILVSLYQRINLFDPVLLGYLAVILGSLGIAIYYLSGLPKEKISDISKVVSNLILFSIIVFFILLALYRRVNIYESFIEGAKEGFDVAIKIIPYLVGIMIAIGVFKESGALEIITSTLKKIVIYFGVNPDFIPAMPTAFMKPLSGSGATGMMLETMNHYGVDSFQGRLVSIFQGTTDTTLYILAIYFGAVNIKKTRYAATCGLLADLIGVITAIYVTYIFYH
ncbi:nucleoside recognition domain-containing protein [Microscilla marina]|uniref:Nucleoside recognition n=1 Tax=Microscilla marina ATCC 23134 TaxID=313606 RepID=A1ZCD0_MICM2|nr:nucleoside recognition domain-containing protein [Microscilla marina]EAY31932.1 nucleoside recognition [Microscilla marina ATCC 23134]